MKSFVPRISIVFLIVSLLFIQKGSAQTLASPYVVNTFPTTLTNVNTNAGETAVGMQGACFTLPCCSVKVAKVTLPSNGILRVEMTNFTPLAGSMIAYRPLVSNPTSYSDLEFISASPGNFCGFRDTLQLGRGYQDWDLFPLGQVPNPTGLTSIYNFNSPSSQNGFFPAGDYYILIFNENQQANIGIGTSTDITFEFVQACEPLTVPSSLQFDTLEFNAASQTLGFYIKNDRSLPVSIDPITGVNLTGVDSGQFSIITPPDSVLAVGDSTLIEIAFAPISGGIKNAVVDITFSDTTCTSTSSVNLSGTGAEAEIVLYGNGVSIPQNDLPPSLSDFTNLGSVVVNTGSITRTYFIVNEGSDTLELNGSPIVDLQSGSQFVLASTVATTVLPGDSTSFSITFTPTTIGLDTGQVTIANNDANQTPFTFRITAAGAGLNGLDFDGSGDWVNIDDVAADMVGVDTFTVEGWVKVDPNQSGNDIFLGVNTSSNGSRMFIKIDDGVMEFDVGSSSDALSGPDLRDDVWHHIAFVFTDGTIQYYVDGVLEDTETNNVPSFNSNDQWSIGQEHDNGGPSDFFNGAINEFRLWHTARTGEEIAGGRHCEVNGLNPDLVAYYSFNQGVAGVNNTIISTLTDGSGNGNDGTLNGFSLTGAESNFVLADNVGAACTSFVVQVCDGPTYTAPSGTVYSSDSLILDTIPNSNGGDSALVIDLTIAYTDYSQDQLADTSVCDTLRVAAATNLTTFGTFENTNSDWIETNGAVDSLVNTNRSIFLWMRAAGTISGSADVLVGINTSGSGTVSNLGIATNEQLWIYDGGNNRNSGVVVTDGNWHFVGYTYDEGSNLTQFWVDGVAAASFSNGQSISSTSRISIGQEFDSSTPSNFFDGDITEVSFWNEVLDSTEIAAIMQASVQASHPQYANLVAYYPMSPTCGEDGFTVNDFGPYGYHGTASSNIIVNTDTLVALPGFNAAASFNKEWSVGGSVVSTSDSLIQIGNVQAGAYNLKLHRDFFAVNDGWNVSVQPSCSGPLASAIVDSNVSCNGFLDGGATASATGGTSPYTYAWSNSATSASITGVAAGVYSVTITDANGQTDSASVTITGPAVLVAASVVDSNVSCHGFFDGGATASATGGTMPYTYTWSNSATNASITGVGAGTYSVTVTDANGCSDSASISITEPVILVASAILDSNDAGSGGGATALAAGGTMAYTYSWSIGATMASITGVSAGTYSVTVTDANGCTDSASVVIASGPNASIVVDSNVSCNGLSDGGLTASASGGTAPYTYAWSNGATNASITGLVAGTYTVTVTDQNGLTATNTGTVSQPAVLVSASVVDSNVTCNSFLDGGATAAATGGAMPYTYTWSNSATNASITGVGAGTYSVTITDANGCTDSTSISISEPAVLVAAAVLDSNDAGNGGGATASVTGGTMAYTYSWSNSATTASIAGVAAGTYSVTITDANGCTDSASITITAGPVPAVMVDSNVSCNGFIDGGATASATGGTSPYTYLWSNSATNASITGVAAGTYTVTITDAIGLTGTTSVSITEPAAIVAATVVDSNVSCNGLIDGGATASATGGTMPYTYTWSNSATNASITGVAAGTYTVSITDANGCGPDTATVTITEPAVLVAATVLDSNASCNGFTDGGATASATGGTMPYSYTWSNSAITASITGVAAGTYTVTVTDNNGCTSTTSINIGEPAMVVAATVVDSTVSCNGFADGGATATATGGTAPYTYAWSNGGTFASITGVAAGVYTVTATDNNGCTSTDFATITQPILLMATVTVDSNESCTGASDGGLSAQVTGGTMPYTYSWSNSALTSSITGVSAGAYSVMVTDANGCTAFGSGNILIQDLTPPTVLTNNITAYLDASGQVSINPAQIDNNSFDACGIDTLYLSDTLFACGDTGSNTVTLFVSDVNGNTDSATATVTVMDTLAPTVQTQSLTVYLDGSGSAVITAAMVDNNSFDNCGIAALALDSSTFDCNETGANTVTLTVTDVNGNTNSATAVITVLDTLVPTAMAQNLTLYLDASGQATTTAAAVDNGSFDNCSVTTLALDSTSFDCSEVGPNTVVLTVTDASGNTDTASAVITVLDTLAPTVQTQNLTLYLDANGQASTTATAVDNNSFDNCGINTMMLDSTAFDCSEVGANTVTLTITDVNGNTNSATATITVLDTVSPTAQTQNITLYLDAAGQATTTASAIDNNSFDNCGIASLTIDSTSFDCSEIGANTVTLTATDVNGNTNSATATVTVLDTLSPTVLTQNITLYLDANGQASTTALVIDNGSFDNCSVDTITLDSTNFDCSETGANTVTLTVTDVNGNVSTGTAVVTVLDTIAPQLIVANDTAVCAIDTNGTIVAFSNSATDNCSAGSIVQVGGLASGSTFPIGITTNVFEVTDASGNVTTDSFTVEVYAFPQLSFDPVGNVCETADPVALNALPAGGVFSGPGVSGSSFDPAAVTSGNQTLTYTFTTLEGCVYSTVSYAEVRENPVVDLGSFTDSICIEDVVVACPVATPAGGTYSGPGIDSILLYTETAGLGQHWITYTYTDSYGCSSSDSTLANIVRCIDPLTVEGAAPLQTEWKVFPNPNRGTFRVQHNHPGEISACIFSMNGAVVKEIPVLTQDHEVRLDHSVQGVFFLHITGDQVNETKRIVIQ